ncbi:hypothetical protein EJ08DRAFT_294615 [Tothia fuscella]|uniref:Uncharacterized protein n=1 Tax=Tothia fuscella TaxID=1048955 RepID=A0A9P4U2M1_9PEZI|nr:hypothetical protein EJ08DRAFT_294615 [Tothia fuscella]
MMDDQQGKSAIVKTPDLEFIIITNPEDSRASAVRTRVKQHVMKDIGRSRRRPKKKIQFELSADPRSNVGPTEVDPFAPFPIEMGATEKRLISIIFEVDNQQRAMRSAWFTLGFFDEATLYIILSNSAAHLDRIRGLECGQKSLETDKFHLKALQSINKRLGQPDLEVNEGLISATSGFMCHNAVVGDSEQWDLHRRGLSRLIGLHGGLEKVSSSHLRESISWVELRGAFMQDIELIFPLPDTWIAKHSMESPRPLRDEPSSLAMRHYVEQMPGSKSWRDIFADLKYFSQLTQAESISSSGSIWTDANDGGGWTNVLLYRLLSWRPLEEHSSTAQDLQECLRIASILYVARVWRKFGCAPVRTSGYTTKLMSFWLRRSNDWSNFWPLEAWILIMGAIEAEDSVRQYFVSEIEAIAQRYSVTLGAVFEEVKNLLWIEDVFDVARSTLLDDLRIKGSFGR